jgi:predicted Zn-dependent protease
MRHRLGESLQSVANFDVPLVSATTSSLDALTAYSQGMQAPSFSASIPYFERALQLDPAFAMAWERLGVANGEIGNLAVQSEAFTKAYLNRAGTTAREEFWITSRYNEIVLDNHEGARKNYELFVKSYPSDDIAWGSLADTLRQMGRYPESLDAALHANSLVKHGMFAQLELAKAYQATGQFERARVVCRDGIAARPNDSAMHQIMQVNDFALKDDAAYAAELAWSKGTDREFQLVAQNAQALATQGRMQEARKEFQRSRDIARAHGVSNFPFIDDAEEALADALSGDLQQARLIAARVPYTMHDVSATAGLAAALSGDTSYTNKLIDALLAGSTEPGSMSRQYFVPLLRAAMAIHNGDGARARLLLEPARIYAMRDYWVWFLTGESYLLTKQPEQAEEQFRAILNNPGIDPVSPMYPLAHRSLASAYALAKKPDASRSEYQQFLACWNHADDGIPVLMSANREFDPSTGPRK